MVRQVGGHVTGLGCMRGFSSQRGQTGEARLPLSSAGGICFGIAFMKLFKVGSDKASRMITLVYFSGMINDFLARKQFKIGACNFLSEGGWCTF